MTQSSKRTEIFEAVFCIVAILAMVLLAQGLANAQPPAATTKPAPPALTEVQQLRLKVAQQEAVIAQLQAQLSGAVLEKANAIAREKYNALNAEGEVIKKEAKIDPGYLFDHNTLTFIKPDPPPEAAKPDKAAPPK